MLRISEFVRLAFEGKNYRPREGITLIWNLTKACNLNCAHCYASAGKRAKNELSTREVLELIAQIKGAGVTSVVLSGGEPLMREDIFEIGKALKESGIRTFLSTNGLLISEENIGEIARTFDYVGISIDGTPRVHDAFRGQRFAFEGSLRSLELCLSWRLKTGIRFTLTEFTAGSLPFVFDLASDIGVDRLYISHLVFSGRARDLSQPERIALKKLVEFIVDFALDCVEEQRRPDVITGNSEPDAIVLLERFSRRFPDKTPYLKEILKSWGGNRSGENLFCITPEGQVKPDPFFFHSLGSLRERTFQEIIRGNGILTRLRERPRRIKGRCEGCRYLSICNGGSRARAYAIYGDYFMEDPGCYLS